MVQLPNVDRFSGTERFLIGVGLTLVVEMLTQARVGLFRLSGFLQILGWAFLGTAFLPAFTGLLGAGDWEEVSTGKQILLLWVAGVGALVLWFAISLVAGQVFSVIV